MMVELLLVRTVESLGVAGSVVRVKPGYARNFLVPQGFAVPATPEQVRAVEEAKRRRAKQGERVVAEAEALKRRLESQPLSLKLAVGAEGKAFGSVTAHDLVEALQQAGIVIDKHAVQLEEPIKGLGIFEVPVRLHHDVTAHVKVWVAKA